MVSGWRKLISQIIFDLNHVKIKSRVTILKCRLQVKNLFVDRAEITTTDVIKSLKKSPAV